MTRRWLDRLRGRAAPSGPPSDRDAYRARLDVVLGDHADAAAAKLRAVAEALPERARRIDVGVHPAQDGTGSFAVMVHPDGPDLVVLQKAVAAHRALFVAKPGDLARLGLPAFVRTEAGRDWAVNDVIAAAAGDWIEGAWRAAGPMPRPGIAFADDDWGGLHRDLPGGGG